MAQTIGVVVGVSILFTISFSDSTASFYYEVQRLQLAFKNLLLLEKIPDCIPFFKTLPLISIPFPGLEK